MDELTTAKKQVKRGKSCGLDNIPAEVWLTYGYINPYRSMDRRVYTPFSKNGDIGKTTNYRGITLTTIASKIYNLPLLYRIRPEVDTILRKNQTVSGKTNQQSAKSYPFVA